MVFDIIQYKSHPDKFLLTQPNGDKGHVNGVIENVRKLTNSKTSELLAIFHDLGKLNPNFQDKLNPNKESKGYTNHAYLSAYAFFSFCYIKENYHALCNFLGITLSSQEMFSLTVLIAKHHSNIPNFDTPDGYPAEAEPFCALSIEELKSLFKFLNSIQLPLSDYLRTFEQFKNIVSFEANFYNNKKQRNFIEQFRFFESGEKEALNFFLDAQFSFACLIQADKADAAKHESFIEVSEKNVTQFCASYRKYLNFYLSSLNQETPLNQLRTQIRQESITNIKEGLQQDQKVFELTAPTGSGKTLMLLSLASEVLKAKGDYRIIYALPFLSITEQVEAEVLKIFPASKDCISRIDSKSENDRFEELQEELDSNPTEEKIQELKWLEFQENTFAYPFVITTFVRFFETLLSNRNSELLKLPNFSRCIFLLDEIQSLPPRLYSFFTAYLAKFCQKFESYAIISTATQPNFELPNKNSAAKSFFFDYKEPFPLLSLNHFEASLFNRYKVEFNKRLIELEELKNEIINEDNSVLVILNTIDDTKDLFNVLKKEGYSKEEILLLNTHFTPQHRKLKISLAKRRLRENKKVIVISTQLIEAGVDIDFPVLYRDLATVSSIIQSAGRCNRNGKMSHPGKVKLFKLRNRDTIRSEMIYRGKDKELLTFTKEAFINEAYEEKELLDIQRSFFNRIQAELHFAKHSQKNPKHEFDFLKDIKQAQFKKIGSFQLIDKEVFGKEVEYFVPRNEKDEKFEILISLKNEVSKAIKQEKNNTSEFHLLKGRIKNHLKKMAGQIVQVRLKNNYEPLKASAEDYFGLTEIALSSYSFEKGIDLKGDDCLI